MSAVSRLLTDFAERRETSEDLRFLTAEELEDERLNAFEKGYTEGWEDALQSVETDVLRKRRWCLPAPAQTARSPRLTTTILMARHAATRMAQATRMAALQPTRRGIFSRAHGHSIVQSLHTQAKPSNRLSCVVDRVVVLGYLDLCSNHAPLRAW